MKYLVIVAHGSRRAASNQEVESLGLAIESLVNDRYAGVFCGFLELAEPSIPDALTQCALAGATHIDVLPYFLAAGRHVQTDVPAEVALFSEQFPNVDVDMLTHLGAMPGLVEFLVGSLPA